MLQGGVALGWGSVHSRRPDRKGLFVRAWLARVVSSQGDEEVLATSVGRLSDTVRMRLKS